MEIFDLGRALMDRARAWLESQGCDRIRLAVAQGNEQALGFYESFGFRPRFTVLERLSKAGDAT